MLKKIVQMKYFCGLDIGTQTLKAAMIRVQDEQNLDLLGVVEQPVMGLKEASISDITELADGIRRVVEELIRKTGIKAHALEIGIGADLLASRRSGAIIPLVDSGTKVISKFDVRKVDGQAKLLGVGLDEELIHAFPQFYKVDDVNTALNPVGLMARKLEANLLLLTANALRVRNFTKAVHQAGFEVSRVSCSAYAACEVVMDKALKEQGAALIDIGYSTTTVLFFKNGIVGDVQLIPWGGQYVSQSIAERLSLTIDMAEEIKKSHAMASQPKVPDIGGEMLVKRDKGYMPISRQSVCDVVNWEIENLLTHLETVVKGSSFYHQLNAGIVMVGGGALLPGLMERIEERTNLTVRMGGATRGLNQAGIYAAAIGLAQMHYLTNAREAIDFKTPKNLKDKIVSGFQELCQEYF